MLQNLIVAKQIVLLMLPQILLTKQKRLKQTTEYFETNFSIKNQKLRNKSKAFVW